MNTGTLEIDPKAGMATARNATLGGGVPVFYLPWMTFPVGDQRKTGLLFPSIGSDTRGGVDITTPIYFNLAPNYDATYSPRYIGERGLLHQANGRWLNDTIGYWDVTGQYIDRDDKYGEDFPTPTANAGPWRYDSGVILAKAGAPISTTTGSATRTMSGILTTAP